jgi:hypothetical protein
MLICIDYDGTYTCDPVLWDTFISTAKKAGHRVICATMRYEISEGEPVKKALAHLVEAIYFTDRKGKQPWLAARGVLPDVWIDDSPTWLLNDAAS